MNIMILNHYAGSDSYGMEFRPLYLGRELVKLGHEVTVLAADHSHLRAINPQVPEDFTDEWIEGVRYVWLKTPEYQGNGAKRFLNMMTFLRKLKGNAEWIYGEYKPDVIVASSTYPYDVKAAKRIASYGKRVKVCYEIHDVWPLSLIELYHLSTKNPYVMSLQRAENYAYRHADLVISILPDVNRHIEQLGFHGMPYVHIPNGVIVDESLQKPAPDSVAGPVAKLKEQGKFIVMYLGGFAKANALEEFLACAPHLPENIQLVMIGDGPLKEEYRRRVEDEGIENVSILPLVTKLQVNHTLRLADALYIGAKRSKLYEFGVGMNKIFDYMLAEKPIIYGIEASNDLIAEAGCGISIPPEDPVAIAAAAKRLAGMSPEERAEMGGRGSRYVRENHDYRRLAQRFAEAVEAAPFREGQA